MIKKFLIDTENEEEFQKLKEEKLLEGLGFSTTFLKIFGGEEEW